MKELVALQKELKVPKTKQAKNYTYRSCEDILEACKPLAAKHGCYIVLQDMVEMIGERYFIKSLASFCKSDSEEKVSSVAFAELQEDKQFMSLAQLTGAASSYARKYALNGLFAIDDSRDDDALDAETAKEPTKSERRFYDPKKETRKVEELPF